MAQTGMIINPLPVRTWNRLKMNETRLGQVEIDKVGTYIEKLPVNASTLKMVGISEEVSNVGSGHGSEFDTFGREIDGGVSYKFTAEKAEKDDYLKLAFKYTENATDINRIGLISEENSYACVAMDYASEGVGTGAVVTRILAKKNSVLHLVQILHVADEFKFYNDIGIKTEDGAKVYVTQIILSGKERYYGLEANLSGKKSALDVALAYRVAGTDRLDMNYIARHLGKKTESVMNAAGSLRDNASKIFRGTIDFVCGAAGAVGNEKEDVLLLDDDVVNQTIPLILCSEEDVVGNHGAAIGRPDDEELFYLEARGISEAAAYKMLADAKLYAVCDRITDEELLCRTRSLIKGEAEEE